MLSEKDALNKAAPGGDFSVAAALDIGGTTESTLILASDTSQVEVVSNQDFYIQFNTGTANAISTANDMKIKANTRAIIDVPWNIGAYAAGSGCVMHVRQVGTTGGITVRAVEK